MKRNNLRPSVLAASFAYMLAGLSPVLMADDTEIFFGGSSGTATNNVLFILDTSGSMATDDEGNGTSRMDDLKEAFKSLLSQVNGVNVGMMRFSNPGGPVLYPVAYIDEEVSIGVTTGSVERSVSSGANDGYQMVGSGAMYLDTTNLELGANAIAGVTYQQRNVRIDNNNDDAESTSATAYTVGSVDIDTPTSDGSTQHINGFRFRSANIPSGATITGAYLEAEVRSTGGNSGTWQVSVAGDLVDGGGDFNANNRHPWYRFVNKTKTTSVDWSVSPLPANDDRIRTPDISDIIQQMVNASGASTTSVVSLLLSQTPSTTFNRRISFKSREGSSNARARLVVDYYTGTPVTGSVLTALRFENVAVPRGAAITGATLEFQAATTSSTATDLTIMAEKAGNSAALTNTAFDVSGRTTTSASVAWPIPSWTVDQTYTTPDISSVVQEVVTNAGSSTDPNNPGFGWCGGNAMTFILRGDAGRQLAKAYESGSANAPVLRISYDTSAIPPGTSCSSQSLNIQVSNGSDDAEQRNSTVSVSDDNIELVANSSVAQQIGFRFRNIAIPKGSQVTSAYLQVQATANDSGSVSYQIYGQDADNAATFSSSANNISSRPKTDAAVTWSVTGNWVDQTNYLSPDIASLVQEVVDRAGWVSGNSLALIVTGTDTATDRRVYSRDDSSSRAARLIINYIDKGQAQTRTVRDQLISITDSLGASGNTPVQDTMYEAALYYRGMSVDYGKQRGNGYSYTRVSTPESIVPSTFAGTNKTGDSCLNSSASSCADERLLGTPQYQSPIDASCQKNYIVLLTDGRPNSPHSQTKISNMIGGCPDGTADADEACVTDLARWLNTADQSSSVSDTQTIVTHTIGFNIADTWLSEIATAGGGQYYEATDANSLATVFEAILGGVQDSTSSFVAAGTSVNAFNRSQNRDELYFAVFKPESRPKWPGNLKKYRIDIDTLEIKDAAGNNAINSAGLFSDTSRSFWSPTIDGADVTKGGAGGMITNYATRNLYTYLGTNKVLTAAVNELVSTNTNLNTAMFDVPTFTAAQLVDLIDWTRGKDVLDEDNNAATDTRFVMADPLHSRPVAVTYGGTEASPDITIYISTNSGFLHAIDNDDGREVFGFIPEELLAIQNDLKENNEGVPHPYGLDGALTTWVIDPENDGVVLDSGGTLQPDNQVWLFASMRRGGRNLYGLDVTSRGSPKIMWTIDENTTGFSALGQTWSQPVKGEISVGGTRTKVLVFGGGYDTNQDNTTSGKRETDGMGNAVYIVNAETGALIWSGGNGTDFTTSFSDMRYSIPSTVSGADVNGDGLFDFFFVGDMGGQVWRFDIRNGQTGSDLVTGGVIADLGVADPTHTESNPANTAVDNRRFYHAPALFVGLSGGQQFLGVAIGSGYRAHPLDTLTDDRFYMIRQTAIYSAPATYTKLTQSNLFDATSNVIQEGTAAAQTAALAQLATQNGWFISMTNEDEKVLSTPLIVAGRVYFTTYQPVASPQPCQPATGTNRSYAMSVYDATAVVDFDNISGLTASDRNQEIDVSGIVDQSATIYIGDKGVKIDGTYTSGLPAGLFIDNKVYWHEYR